MAVNVLQWQARVCKFRSEVLDVEMSQTRKAHGKVGIAVRQLCGFSVNGSINSIDVVGRRPSKRRHSCSKMQFKPPLI